jgi:allantoinase
MDIDDGGIAQASILARPYVGKKSGIVSSHSNYREVMHRKCSRPRLGENRKRPVSRDGGVTADLVIRGGTVVGPERSRPADVVVDAGVISAVTEPGEGGTGRQQIDARGLTIFPGAIDAHVHFDAPGREAWEGWETGSLAAAAGGVTTVIDMPIDSDPPTIDPPSVQAKCDLASATSLVDFALWGGLVPGNVDSLDPLLRAGVVGLKAFMCDSGWPEFPACDVEVLERGMKAAARADRPVAVHCEDPSLFGPGRGDRPVRSEVAAVATAGAAAAAQGARLHVVHCSSAEAVAQAKRWPGVTVETCPHYLLLNEADAGRIGPDALCAPPIRDEAARADLWHALRRGLIDTIASDHSPCPPSGKSGPSPFAGISGVQTTLSLLLTDGSLSVGEISRFRTAAASIFGLRGKGVVAPGFDADLALVDLEARWTVSAETLHDRHRRSPFSGQSLRGVVVATLVRGAVVYETGQRRAEPRGKFLTPEPRGGVLAQEEMTP